MRKRINRETNLFVCVVLFSFCMTLLVTIIIHKLNLYNKEKLLYTSFATEMNIEDANENDLLEVLNHNKKHELLIMKNNLDFGIDLRGIYYLGNLNCPGTKQGRFFTNKECLENTRKVVIGEQLEKNKYRRAGKDYIKVNAYEFEVIGILDSSNNEYRSNIAFIPITTSIKLFGVKGQYAIDGNKIDGIQEIIGRIKTEKNSIQVLYPSAILSSPLRAFIKNSNEVIYMYLLLFISLIFSLIKGIIYWFDFNKDKIYIYKVLGLSDSTICAIYYKKYLKNILLSIIVGLMFVYIITNTMISYRISIYHYISYLLFMTLLSIMTITLMIVKELLKVRAGGVK